MLTLDLWGIGIWLFAPRARVTMGALDRNGHFERHDDMESLATATACQCHQSNHSCLHDFSIACFWTGKGLSFNTYPATDFLFAQEETYLPPLSRNGPNPLISTIKCTKCFNLPETWESPNWCTDRMTILVWWSCTTPSHKVTTLAPTCRGCRKNWPPKSKLLKSCYDCGWNPWTIHRFHWFQRFLLGIMMEPLQRNSRILCRKAAQLRPGVGKIRFEWRSCQFS